MKAKLNPISWEYYANRTCVSRTRGQKILQDDSSLAHKTEQMDAKTEHFKETNLRLNKIKKISKHKIRHSNSLKWNYSQPLYNPSRWFFQMIVSFQMIVAYQLKDRPFS